MSASLKRIYEFGPFTVDPVKRVLLSAGRIVPLPPKAFDTLLALVEHHGQVLEKEKLMEMLWPDSFVEESNLTYNISLLRKAWRESQRAPLCCYYPGPRLPVCRRSRGDR